MKKKEVSMTELFFDLIFVYILSTINQTAEGISHNFNVFRRTRKKLHAFSRLFLYMGLSYTFLFIVL